VAPDRLVQLQKLLAADPNDTFCLYGIAQEYARRGATDEAVLWYDRCIGADPNYCYAYFHKAKALEEAGRVDAAIAALRIGLERAKASRDSHAASEIASYLDELT
jgi:tetratricopeptide (TPR) repeat protein